MTATTSRQMPFALGVLKACRPKQWAKNVLVFVAPAAATALVSKGADGGLQIHTTAILQAVLAFVAFSMVASGTYLINDSMDVEADRQHPKKRHRPIAAGVVPVPFALVLSGALIVGGLLLALSRNWEFALIVALYVVQTTLYSLWLKHEPVLDVVALSSGFLLRLVGGAVAVEVDISDWFFIISCFGALFIAVGKRLAEQREMTEGGQVRATLKVYTEPYLRFLEAVSAGIVLVGYVQWAFERADLHSDGAIWTQLSILPFLVAILRYSLLVELGRGSAPEDLLLDDRQMQVIGLIWVILVGAGFYFGGG